jgi:hypothetical protein
MYRLRSRSLCRFRITVQPQLTLGLGLSFSPKLTYASANNAEEGMCVIPVNRFVNTDAQGRPAILPLLSLGAPYLQR